MNPRLASLLLLLCLGSSSAQAQTDEHLERAIDTYARAMESSARDERVGLFLESERLFGAAAAAGYDNAALQSNLGNAALGAERLGHAILAYRRALLIDPGHTRARENLAHARGLLPDWVPRPPEKGLVESFFFWRDEVSALTLATIAAGFFALGAGLIALSIVRPSGVARGLAGLALLVWATLGLSILFDPARESAQAGVVIVPEATARAADSINAPLRFGEPLPAGSELRLLEDRGGWLHVELFNGRSAWLTSSSVARVVPKDADPDQR